MAENKNEVFLSERSRLRIDLDKLTEHELEELARLIVKKLRDSMSRERDRTGNI